MSYNLGDVSSKKYEFARHKIKHQSQENRRAMGKRITIIWLFLAAFSMSVGTHAQESTVMYRKSIMGAVGGHAGAIAEIAYGGVDYSDHLVGHTEALKVLTTLVLTAFQEEAITDDPPTRAKAAIWEQWSEFEQYANDLQQAAADVAETAKDGDMDAVAASLDPLWDACKACHEPFRQEEY